LRRLEELARRQQELAAQQRQQQQRSPQRWQQEMLRREAEELQRRMEQLTRGDTRLQQALERLRQATEDMRGSGQEGGARTRRAAERLEEARDLMRGMRNQESSRKMNDMVGEAEQLAERQQDAARRVDRLFPEPAPEPGSAPSLRRGLTREQFEESRRLAEEKQKLSERMAELERRMQDAAREFSGAQAGASSRLRRALGDMQKDELALRMRYNTELLRQGLGQYAKAREAPITRGLENLRDQLRDARSAMGRDPSGPRQGVEQTLVQVEEMRRRMEAMRGGPGVFGDWRRLRESLRGNPEVAAEAERLAREMERLDPSRFPGNPELLSRMYTQLLPALEQIELQLRRKLDEQQGGQVRTGASEPVPEGYADAVAEYFRRLSRQR